MVVVLVQKSLDSRDASLAPTFWLNDRSLSFSLSLCAVNVRLGVCVRVCVCVKEANDGRGG